MSEDFINLEKNPRRKKDITLSMIVIVLILVFVFFLVGMKEYSAREMFSTASDKIVEEVEELFSISDTEEEEKEKEEVEVENEGLGEDGREEPAESQPITTEEYSYTEKAEKGDGLTHLARKAVTSYMNEEEINLSAEERVYAEDYVQKRLAPEKAEPRFLEIGEEIEISKELIEEGVQEAQELTPSQEANLTPYANLVSF